jgi:hypothetical protein
VRMISSNCPTNGVRSASGISGNEIDIARFYQRFDPATRDY